MREWAASFDFFQKERVVRTAFSHDEVDDPLLYVPWQIQQFNTQRRIYHGKCKCSLMFSKPDKSLAEILTDMRVVFDTWNLKRIAPWRATGRVYDLYLIIN